MRPLFENESLLSSAPLAGLLVALSLVLGCGSKAVKEVKDEPDAGPAPVSGGTWESAVELAPDVPGDERFPQVLLDDDGNAVVVWAQNDGTRFSIMAMSYTPDAGWTPAELIETDDAGDALYPKLAQDASGTVFVAWMQTDGSGLLADIWSNRFTFEKGWGTAERIENDSEFTASRAQIVADSLGNVLVVWLHGSEVWSNLHTAGSGWGDAGPVPAGQLGLGALQADPTGGVIAVWEESDDDGFGVWSNRFDADQGWGTAERIGGVASPQRITLPQIAVDPMGNALAVWDQEERSTSQSRVWANRYTAGSGWAEPEPIENRTSEHYDPPRVALDSAGNGMAVWSYYGENADDAGVMARRFSLESGWGPHETVVPGHTSALQLAMEPEGNALVMWSHFDGLTANLFAREFSQREGWLPAQLADTLDSGGGSEIHASANQDGVVMATWIRHSRFYTDVWANRLEELGGRRE